MSGRFWRTIHYFETLVGFYVLALGVSALGDLLSAGGDVVFPLFLFFGGSLMSSHGSLYVLHSPVDWLSSKHNNPHSKIYSKIFWVMFMTLLLLAMVFIVFTRAA
jgi:hypothetical protein